MTIPLSETNVVRIVNEIRQLDRRAGRTEFLDSIAGSFDGIEVTFDLTLAGATFTPRDETGLIVSFNGVIQIPGAGNAFTVAGAQITFASAPAGGDTCAIWSVNA